MKLTRVLFVALAILLPTAWTVAKAEDAPAPAEGKKEKKAKKGKKADKPAEEKKEMTK